MFSTKEFIEASRKFVCIRIETYENKESEELVKRVLKGKLANTAFAIISPDGKRMLTRGGRSPSMAMSDDRGRTDRTGRENDEIIGKLQQIARQYRTKGKAVNLELQDFHSLRQALNCSAADQRLLVFVNAANQQRLEAEDTLRSVFADNDVIGKFHLDFVDADADERWRNKLSGEKNKPGIMVVRASQFGLDGTVLEQLAIDSEEDEIRKALLKANTTFAKTEVRKDYEKHVQTGRRQRVNFENEISRRGSDGQQGRRNRGRAGR